MATMYSPKIVTDGLALYLDAGNPRSYPGSGTTWYDISGRGDSFQILAAAYTSTSPKYMNFGGASGCAKHITSDFLISGSVTAVVWTRPLTSTSTFRTLFRGRSSTADHQVIIQNAGYNFGMYDNTTVTAFNDTGFSQQNLPGWDEGRWQMLTWRWPIASDPYHIISYNGGPIMGSISLTRAGFKGGFCSLGAYHDGNQDNPSLGSQYWGDVAVVLMYNRILSDKEIIQTYRSTRPRFGV